MFKTGERSVAETHLPGGLSKDERRVGPKNGKKLNCLTSQGQVEKQINAITVLEIMQ